MILRVVISALLLGVLLASRGSLPMCVDRSALPGCLNVDLIPDAIHMLALAPGTVNRLRFVVRYRDDFLELLLAIPADELVDRHDGLSFIHGGQLLKTPLLPEIAEQYICRGGFLAPYDPLLRVAFG